MADTTFVSGTVVQPDWLNDVNDRVYTDIVNVKNDTYGAVGDGVTDDTSALLAAFTAAMSANKTVVLPPGTYKVTGPITTNGTTTSVSASGSGSLNIHCLGPVTISVDSSSTAFQRLITLYTSTVNSSSITGARLTLDLNNKCACGIYLRHDASSTDGTVQWSPITVNDTYNAAPTAVMETAGVQISGRYASVSIESPIITGVDRLDTAGVCKGISISEIDGPILIKNPYVANVLCTGATADADGISVFGRTVIGVYNVRGGSLELVNPVIRDCEGRSIKTQITKSTIVGGTIYRKLVVAFVTADIDHQVGGHHVLDGITFDYLKNGGTSPITSGFYPVSFQQRCIDAPGMMVLKNSQLKTESTVPYLVYVTVGSTAVDGFTADALNNFTVVTMCSAEGQGTLAGSVVITRGLVEFQAERVRTNANKTYIDTSFNTVDLAGIDLVTYTSSTSATVNNLFASAVSNVNIGSSAGVSRISAASGTTITTFGVDRGVSNSNIT